MATVITNVTQLQAMENGLTEDYELGNDIDASATSGWNGGAGFDPIGDAGSKFTGSFDGKGFKISDLFVNRGGSEYNGLFGYAQNATIQNVEIEDCDITGDSFAGALAGYVYGSSSTINNCKSSGTITGIYEVGGLIGQNNLGVVTECRSSCTVASTGMAGGLIGYNGGVARQSFATGAVTGAATAQIGGFYGFSDSGSDVDDCYAKGSVTAAAGDPGFYGQIGGFAGMADGSIDNCYSTGAVSGQAPLVEGGFIGETDGATVIDCFWDTETSGKATSDGGTGKTTAQMKAIATFQAAGWAISRIWSITEGCNDSYPCLIGVNTCCMASSGGSVDQTIIGNKISLEAIRNLEIVYGGRAYISKSGDFVYESRYHRSAS